MVFHRIYLSIVISVVFWLCFGCVCVVMLQLRLATCRRRRLSSLPCCQHSVTLRLRLTTTTTKSGREDITIECFYLYRPHKHTTQRQHATKITRQRRRRTVARMQLQTLLEAMQSFDPSLAVFATQLIAICKFVFWIDWLIYYYYRVSCAFVCCFACASLYLNFAIVRFDLIGRYFSHKKSWELLLEVQVIIHTHMRFVFANSNGLRLWLFVSCVISQTIRIVFVVFYRSCSWAITRERRKQKKKKKKTFPITFFPSLFQNKTFAITKFCSNHCASKIDVCQVVPRRCGWRRTSK